MKKEGCRKIDEEKGKRRFNWIRKSRERRMRQFRGRAEDVLIMSRWPYETCID